jgi:hypothetical protein
MEMTELLARAGALRSMAHELGVSETQARSGAEALVPAILGGFKKQVQSQPSGLEGLGGMLGELGAAGCWTTCWRRSPPTSRAATRSSRASSDRRT